MVVTNLSFRHIHGTEITMWHWDETEFIVFQHVWRERGGSVVACRTPERKVGGSKPTAAVLCPWARHFTPQKYWLITQEAVAPSRHDWKIVDWDVKPQHKQTTCVEISRSTRVPVIGNETGRLVCRSLQKMNKQKWNLAHYCCCFAENLMRKF